MKRLIPRKWLLLPLLLCPTLVGCGRSQAQPGAQGPPPFTVLAAAGIIAIAPCLLLVILFNRRVVAGITEGFVKG